MAPRAIAVGARRSDPSPRTGVHAFPEPRARSVLRIAAQGLHECEHHVAEIDERIVGPR